MTSSDNNRLLWLDIANKNRVLGLFRHYVLLTEKAPHARIVFNASRSVAVHLDKPPVLSLHLNKSNEKNGLWIGYSKSNLGRHLQLGALSSTFQKQELVQGSNYWYFGYITSASDLNIVFREVFGNFELPQPKDDDHSVTPARREQPQTSSNVNCTIISDERCTQTVKALIPTSEQTDIIEHAAMMAHDEALTVTAFAGAAKTSTLVMLAEAMPDRQILYLAFNKAIVEEAKKKFPSNVSIKTTHALAYSYTAVGKQVRNNNYKAIEVAEIFNIEFGRANKVLSLFEFYCNSSIRDISKLDADKDILGLTTDFYEQMRTEKLAITHSFYLKEFQLLLSNGLKLRNHYDYALLDEAQDTNGVTLSIFNSLPGKKIKVGDQHQAIYGFRGAINGMFDKTGQRGKSSSRYLSTTFRCAPHIVDKANWVLNTFKGETQKIISGNNKAPELKAEAILSRTNSKLIEFIDNLPDFNLTRPPDIVFDCLLSLVGWKYNRHHEISKQFKFLLKFSNERVLEDYIAETGDKELSLGLNLLSQYDSDEWRRKGFPDGKKIQDLYLKAKNNYVKNGSSAVTLTTAHSAKGLEYDKVTITDDFPDVVKTITQLINKNLIDSPSDFINSRNLEVVAAKEEVNLYYVAVTRAKFELQDESPFNDLFVRRSTIAEIFERANLDVIIEFSESDIIQEEDDSIDALAANNYNAVINSKISSINQDIEVVSENLCERNTDRSNEVESPDESSGVEPVPPALDASGKLLFKQLRKWRNITGTESQFDQDFFLSISNKALFSVAYLRPQTKNELIEACGIDPSTADKYGAEILSVVVDTPFVESDTAKPVSKRKRNRIRVKKKLVEFVDLGQSAQDLFECLRTWRNDKAMESQFPNYCIVSNRALSSIAHLLPKTIDDLSNVYGVGSVIAEKYGEEIITIVNDKQSSKDREEVVNFIGSIKPVASNRDTPNSIDAVDMTKDWQQPSRERVSLNIEQGLPLRSYAQWSKAEDDYISQSYLSGNKPEFLSKQLNRNLGGITSRLAKLGLIQRN